MRISDWSSDVCSADLNYGLINPGGNERQKCPTEPCHLMKSRSSCRAMRPSWPAGRAATGCSRPAGITPGCGWQDRKSVAEGQSVSVRVDLGGRRIIKKKKQHRHTARHNITYTH